jgi:hypothetical protein
LATLVHEQGHRVRTSQRVQITLNTVCKLGSSERAITVVLAAAAAGEPAGAALVEASTGVSLLAEAVGSGAVATLSTGVAGVIAATSAFAPLSAETDSEVSGDAGSSTFGFAGLSELLTMTAVAGGNCAVGAGFSPDSPGFAVEIWCCATGAVSPAV